MVTPYLATRDIPMIAINHTYQTMEMFSKPVVSGGTGIYYSAGNIWIIGRRQDRETGGDKEVLGYEFIINVDKSRFIKEKSKISINVSWEGGINKYSGLLELAVEGGFVSKGKKGKSLGYSHIDPDTGEISAKVYYEHETDTADFWDRYLTGQKFEDYVMAEFAIPESQQIAVAEIEEMEDD
jgi:hypothetical protein